MQDYFDITVNNYQCWYGLSWKPRFFASKISTEPELPGLETEVPVIILKMHNSFVDEPENFPFPCDSPLVIDLKNQFGFLTFNGELNTSFFGFDYALFNNGITGDFIEFVIPLPKKFQIECDQCDGIGWSEWRDDECMSCSGTGKRNAYKWQKANAIVASLEILFRYGEQPTSQTSSSKLQLMTINAFIRKEQDRILVMLGGKFSPALCDWFRTIGVQSIDESVQAMRVAYDYMQGLRVYDSIRASIQYQNGWFSMDCPGDRTGIYPHYNSVHSSGGYKFADHNIDTPFQFLTVLSGLAALYDEARIAGI